MFKLIINAKSIISVLKLSIFTCFIVMGSQLLANDMPTHSSLNFIQENSAQTTIKQTIQKELQKLIAPHTDTWITVFVHGIKSIRPHISLNNVVKFMQDNVEDTVYAKTVDLMRRDPHFYQNQPMQGLGLQKINPNDIRRGYAAGAMAYLFEEVFAALTDRPQTNNFYYTFGWSGLLSPSMRFYDGTQLFLELEKEVQRYELLYNITPKVRVIAYSHGGNVCLNLGAAHQRVFPRSKLTIEELILIGVPIQSATDYLVADSVFKNVYHFYSLGDRIQKLDFFASDKVFKLSRRRFVDRPGFKLPKKLVQIQLKMMRGVYTKSTKNNRKKVLSNFDNEAIIAGNRKLFRDVSPGHTELWFFGWAPSHYRKTFPTNPLPCIGFTPMIIHEINKIRDQLPIPHSFIVDLRPEQESFLIKRKNNVLVKKADFLTIDQLDYLKNNILLYKPYNYTLQLYNDHMYAAYEHALVIHTKENKSKNPKAYVKAKQKQKEKEHERLERLQKTISIKNAKNLSSNNLKKKKRTKRSEQKEKSITASLHQEINCPFCYDPDIQKYLTI